MDNSEETKVTAEAVRSAEGDEITRQADRESAQAYRQSVEEHNTKMSEIEKKQLKYMKLSFIMSMLSALFTGAMLAVVVVLAMYIVPKVDTIYSSTMVSLANLEQVTEELKEANLSGTVENINTLTVQATGDLSNAMERLNSIDFETLNQAIDNLNSTIEPLAKFFGR